MQSVFYKDKVIIITGGSSGIGLALANEFIMQQAQVVLIARDEVKLQTAKKLLEANPSAKVSIIAADVSDNASISAAINKTANTFGCIDLLINNAGIMTCGRFADQPVEDLEKCVFINYLGCVYASKAAWPWLKQSKGQLSFVSSVAGYVGLIGYSSYTPAKFAITGLAECLRMEGVADEIKVSVIYPPDTNTPMREYEVQHTLAECLALSKNIKAIQPEKVAKIYINGLQKNKFEIYCDLDSRFVRSLKNNLPGLFNYITIRIIKKAGTKK
jgi:3-dehydrosphinganine reductase